MRIACLQHVPFEGPAGIGVWAASRGHAMHITRLFDGEPVPAGLSFDALLIMGGLMSVNDTDRFGWLEPEKQFIRHTIENGKPAIGICLGAQLIAAALGAEVIPSPEREIGWFPVHQTPDGVRHPVFGSLPPQFDALHWHGETHGLPEGATCVARSEGCPQQAFLLGDRVLGLQFHLESTPDSLKALVQNCPEDLKPGRFVQDASTMLGSTEHFDQSNHLMNTLLDAFLPAQCRRD